MEESVDLLWAQLEMCEIVSLVLFHRLLCEIDDLLEDWETGASNFLCSRSELLLMDWEELFAVDDKGPLRHNKYIES